MLDKLDLAILGAYLLIVFITSFLLSKRRGIEGFLVNARATPLSLLVFSIISTTIGAGFFVSVAAEGYKTGLSFGLSIAVVVAVTALLLAAMAPRIKALADEGRIYTVPQLLSWRYGSADLGRLAGCTIAVGYLFVTALQFVGIAGLASVISGTTFPVILLMAGVFTVVLTSVGGFENDIYVDAISFIVMVIGVGALVIRILTIDPPVLSHLPPGHLNPFAFGGPSFFIMAAALSAISAFIFMELWQRIFAAASAKVARRAFLISAIVQPLFVAAAVVIGLAAAGQFKGIDKEEAVYRVIATHSPDGLSGLAVAALVAVIITTVNSLVVVGGSTLYVDVLGKVQRDGHGRNALTHARALTAVFGVASLSLALLVPDLVKLLLMGAFVLLPLCPAIAWAIFGGHRNARVAGWSIILGLGTTLALISILPQTAFGPGFLVSLLVMLVGHLMSSRTRKGAKS